MTLRTSRFLVALKNAEKRTKPIMGKRDDEALCSEA